MKWITSTDLKNWAPERDCQENLPLLIRKLIRAESVYVSEIRFPSGDNIVLSGWDGRMKSEKATLNIPAGDSVWEIGCRKDYKEKIKKDYKSRTDNTLQIIPSETTFVFVTPYVWSEKDDWIKEKEKEGIWKAIQIIDGVVLEEWIENHSSVGAWLSKYLGKTSEILPLDDYWSEWSSNSKHTISPTLVLSDRDANSNIFLNFIQQPAASIIIKSSTIYESIAFVAASVYKSDNLFQEEILSRTVIVETESDFRNIIVQRRPLILLAKFEDNGVIDKAVKNGHHVIVPIGFDTTSNRTVDINLPRIRRKGFENGLQEMGFNREEAEKLTRDSGQNLSVLRRILQFVKNQQPEWAKENNHLDLIPAVLAGSWDEQEQGDKDIISELAGISYEQYISKLARWKLHKDAPIVQIGTMWKVTSSLDAWSILATFLLKKDFENFKIVVCKVLTEINPSLELDPGVRYFATIQGKKTIYSNSIKQSLSKSMVLIGVFGEAFGIKVLTSSQKFIDSIVYEILSSANGKNWCSLNYYLPLISEASPDIFLRELNETISNKTSDILEMFQETKSIIASNSYHTGLLWGLENLAVSQSYLMPVTLVLGKLANIDPGGNLVNRPANSLRGIFIPWYIQTSANLEIRKTILKKLADSEPEVAWNLFINLLPDNFRTVSPINKCLWRFNEQNIEPSTTYEEIYNFYSFLVDQLIQRCNYDAKKLNSLINLLDHLSVKDRDKLLVFFIDSKEKIKDDTYEIWNSLRKLMARHYTHSDTKWALPPEELRKIRNVVTLYEPVNEVQKNLYLFEDNWIELPEGPKRKDLSHEKQQELFLKLRKRALSSIYNNLGIDEIILFAEKSRNALIVGISTAHLQLSKESEFKLLLILNEKNKPKFKDDFIKFFILEKANLLGEEWIKSSWEMIENLLDNTESKVDFFLSIPQNGFSWQLLSKTTHEISEMYWKKVTPWLYRVTKEERTFAFAQLQSVNRFITVLENASHFVEELSANSIAEILVKAATNKSDESVKIDDYHVTTLFKEIKDKGGVAIEKEIQLEWLYIDFLTSHYSQYKPYRLLDELTVNPDFFVEVVSYIYKPDDSLNSDDSLTTEQHTILQRRAEGAHKLLECWRNIPGMNDKNEIDSLVLYKWVDEAQKIGIEKNRKWATNFEIGKMLATFPRNNQYWPCDAICEVIDNSNNCDMLDSFRTEVFNSRGTYSKSAYEGGEQERNLSSYFERMYNQILQKWPLTASALLTLSKSYAMDAVREDEHAQLDELRF